MTEPQKGVPPLHARTQTAEIVLACVRCDQRADAVAWSRLRNNRVTQNVF